MAEAVEIHRVAFVRRRLARALGWLAFAAAVLPLGGLLALEHLGGAGELLHWGGVAALPLALLSAILGRDVLGTAGDVRREGDELVLEQRGRERRLPLSFVTGAIIVPERGRAAVELHLADGNQITARVREVADAEKLLRELRVGVENQRCRVQIADRAAAMVVALGAPVGISYFGSIFFGLIFFPMLFRASGHALLTLFVGAYALTAALLQTLIAPPPVTVGTDGLSFPRGLRQRFIPYSDLEDIRLVGLGVRLHLRGGKSVLLPSIAAVSNARLAALKLRIQEALALRDATPHHALSQLDRGGRTIRAWRATLASLTQRASDYRGAGLSAEDLEALLSSPDATPERRVGAAVALAAGKHPGAAERIRVAAAQCASERLRIALEKVSEGDEDEQAIAEALGEEKPRRMA